MDVKRKVFLGLSYSYLISLIYTGFLMFSGSIGETIGGFVISYLLGVCFSIIVLLLSFIGKSNTPDVFDVCPFTFGYLTHKRKRIYYADLGYFYMRSKNDSNKTIVVSKQGYLISKVLIEVDYNGSIDELRSEIKSNLDYLYKDELERIKRKKELNGWDGYIDIQSKRDDKINQVIN